MIEQEYRGMIDAYSKAGGDAHSMESADTCKMVIHENKVLSSSEVPGVHLENIPKADGVTAILRVDDGVKVKNPIHMCFGLLPDQGVQDIIMRVDIGKNADVSVFAHCVFPNAVKVIHKMDAVLNIGDGARYSYKETHFHGDSGGIDVLPTAKVILGRGAIYENSFSLIEGSVGNLVFDYDIVAGPDSVTEMIAKIYGKNDDIIKIFEKVHLDGENARSMIKTRIVLRDRAQAEMIGETYGNAAYARGHVDCTELVNGSQCKARAVPIVSVTNDKAKVTHEAAIGSVDRRQVETLMARGLDENEAVDVIVRGLLR